MSAPSGKPRPAYNRLLTALRAGEIDVIVCWSSDRLYRRPMDLEDLLEMAEAGQLQIRAIHSGDLDLSTPEGRAVARTLVAWNKAEVERLAERVKRKRESMREEGLWLGGNRPFGYQPVLSQRGDGKVLEVVPSEGMALREAVVKLLNGASLSAIARNWNADGITTPKGNKWSPSTLRNMLKLDHPGILPDSDQIRLRALFDDPERQVYAPRRSKYLLTGLLRCGKCGAFMVGRPREDKTRRYICTSEGVHLAIAAQSLERYVGVEASRMHVTMPAVIHAADDPLVLEREAVLAKINEVAEEWATTGSPFAARAGHVLEEQLQRIDALLTEETTAEEEDQYWHSLWGELDFLFGEPGWAEGEGVDAFLSDPATSLWLEGLIEAVTIAPGRKGANTFDKKRVAITWRAGVAVRTKA